MVRGEGNVAVNLAKVGQIDFHAGSPALASVLLVVSLFDNPLKHIALQFLPTLA
jgi:hypothetical protein